MYALTLFTFYIIIYQYSAQEVYESDVNFRIEAGSTTCFFERGKAGQMMEAQYQVVDGQHGDLDISFMIKDPNGVVLLNDYKKSHNAVIMDLEVDGDYVFCMDNSFSLMNSKLVFVYVLVEDKEANNPDAETTVTTVDGDGQENEEVEILQWQGTYENGETYDVEVTQIVDSLTRTLRHVVRARHAMDLYGALKSRDSYLALEDTFIVDVWSGFQIGFMFLVGSLQVYVIKQLFNRSGSGINSTKPY